MVDLPKKKERKKEEEEKHMIKTRVKQQKENDD